MRRYRSSIVKLVVFIVAAIIVYIWTPHTHTPKRVKLVNVPKGVGFSVVKDNVDVYNSLEDDAKIIKTLSFGDKIHPTAQSSLLYKIKTGRDKDGEPIYGYVKKKGVLTYNPKKKHIALTFDDGPNRITTPIVLKALKKNNCRATFFVVGKMINRKGMTLLRQEAAQGCEIGNHSYSHPLLTDLKKKKINEQLEKTDKLIQIAVGKPAKLCRAPYGGFNRLVLSIMKRANIYWSIDTLDWKTNSSKKTFRKIKKFAGDGDIVLMHDIHMPTAKAVDRICRFLKAKNFEMVTMTELASIQGRDLVPGRNYISLKKKK